MTALDLTSWIFLHGCKHRVVHLDKLLLKELYPFRSLRIALINESKAVRAAGLRVIRLCLQNEESAKKLVQADLHHFIAKYSI